ncbi:MAG: transposase [Rhizobacter sp.]|nr:transposase [Rhizobacter sp.]
MVSGRSFHLEEDAGQGALIASCQDWANTKAAYRFLSNDDVDEHTILAGHFQAARDRAQASSGPLL